jgi:hypothetical protein
LLSVISATTVVDGYFQNDMYKKDATITNGESITLNAIFTSTGSITSKSVNVPYGLSSIENSCTLSQSGHTYSCSYHLTAISTGIFEIRITGTDNSGSTDSEYLTLIVNPTFPSNHAPVAENQNVITNEDTSVTITLSALDIDSDDLTYFITSNPSHGDLSGFDSSTGQVTYSPDSGFSGCDSFTFKAYDGHAYSNIATVSITVTSSVPIYSIDITSNPVTSVIEGNNYYYDVEVDYDGIEDLIYSLMEAPGWLHINPNTGLIEGTAPLVSSNEYYTVKVEVYETDNYNNRDEQTYTLKVKNYVYSTSTTPRVIGEDFYYQNKYYDQFNKEIVTYTSPTTPKIIGLNISTFFYFLIAIISIGIIIVVFLLVKNLRR